MHVIKNYKDFDFYRPDSDWDQAGAVIMSFWEGTDCYFWHLKDLLIEEKC